MSKTLGGGTPGRPISHWGAGAPRHRTSAANWSFVRRWDRQAALEQDSGVLTPGSSWGGRVGFWPVFCASLADVFDNEVDPFWRRDLWDLVVASPHLTWLMLTKRIGNVRGMMPSPWVSAGFPPNVWIGATIVNQEEADRDLPKLLALPAPVRFVSYEPALGPVTWFDHLVPKGHFNVDKDAGERTLRAVAQVARAAYKSMGGGLVDWIICGGESGPAARFFDLSWAHDTVLQCAAAGVPCFVKQLGCNFQEDGTFGRGIRVLSRDPHTDPERWPAYLRVREFPDAR